jgi:Arc/MetJ-type ribon-helix-helix transcriptional regulator
MPKNVVKIDVRLPESLAAGVDRVRAAVLRDSGIEVNRSDAVRALLREALVARGVLDGAPPTAIAAMPTPGTTSKKAARGKTPLKDEPKGAAGGSAGKAGRRKKTETEKAMARVLGRRSR